MTTLMIKAEITDNERAHTLKVFGRNAWAFQELIQAGARGVTPVDTPGPRWSAYVHNLRGMGLDIETLNERHGGEFPGTHARYVLRSQVQVLEGVE